MAAVIMLTRLNGVAFGLNPDLIERADSTPDTVLTLVDGTKYVICESVSEVIAKVRWLRASILAAAADFESSGLRSLDDSDADDAGGDEPSIPRTSHRAHHGRLEVLPFTRST